jgi:hypothetical protein
MNLYTFEDPDTGEVRYQGAANREQTENYLLTSILFILVMAGVFAPLMLGGPV